ncbi:MAG: glycosyltransferase family 2 protein [Acidobacteria bacterium]|nr:glycosyltransferase family 2 protein [Acidobacteriota bacterium]
MSETHTDKQTAASTLRPVAASPSKPLVSVIMPTYNNALYIGAALDSVLQQTFQDFEIIVIDDGSTDNTAEVLQPYRDAIRYLKKANGGPSSARNLGIALAQGEFIAFHDSDDTWVADKLALQLDHFAQNPEVGVVFTGSHRYNAKGIVDSNIRKGHTMPTGMIFDKILTDHFIAMPSVMVRKSCLDHIGLFEEGLIGNEDFNLYLRLARHYAFGFVNKVLVHIRLHEHNLSDNLAQMCEDEIKNLDKIAALFPDARIPKRQLSGRIYARFGRYYFALKAYVY